jgi:hypothetical protein
MSIVAIREIKRDEEVLVCYNYDLRTAPGWYRELWQNHVKILDENLDKMAGCFQNGDT